MVACEIAKKNNFYASTKKIAHHIFAVLLLGCTNLYSFIQLLQWKYECGKYMEQNR